MAEQAQQVQTEQITAAMVVDKAEAEGAEEEEQAAQEEQSISLLILLRAQPIH